MGMVPPIQITADEVNQIVYAYLKDSGYEHTAFSLRSEARLDHSLYFDFHVPRGELIELLTKALLYVEVETHCKGEGLVSDCKAPFRLLKRHACAADPLDDVNGAAPAPDKNGKRTRASSGSGLTDAQLKRKADTPADGDIHDRRVKRSAEPEGTDGGEPMVLDSPDVPAAGAAGPSTSLRPVSPLSLPPTNAKHNGFFPRAPKNQSGQVVSGAGDDRTPKNATTFLSEHKAEVFVGAWNPSNHHILATGSKDATALIWDLPDVLSDRAGDPSQYGIAPKTKPLELLHLPMTDQKDITTLDWSPDGEYLATGSYDAIVRVWTAKGGFFWSNPQHQGPIFAVKFSKTGRWLLTASLDGLACVWDVQRKNLKQLFKAHECCLDVDWLTDDTFATCGADKMINIMTLGRNDPIKTFTGHTDEINQVKFNPSRTLLASCSDDQTARVWSVEDVPGASRSIVSPSKEMLVLRGHEDSIGCIGWSSQPTKDGHDILATTSFNGTARMWDAHTGECLRAISDHKRAAYTLTFSPEGKFLATASGDGWIYVYRVPDGERIWAWFSGSEKTGIYEICWQQVEGLKRIALCLENKNVAIIDVTMVPALTED